MNKNRKWTNRENKYLEKWFGKKRYSEIGNFLGRKTLAVVHQAIRLGLREHQRKMWTKQEELFLLKNFHKMTLNQISKRLKRTESSVVHKAHIDLKLKKLKTRKWTPSEKRQLKQHYGKIPVAELAARFNRTITSIYSYAKLQKIPSKRAPGYSEKEKNFIRKNYLKMTNEQLAEKLN